MALPPCSPSPAAYVASCTSRDSRVAATAVFSNYPILASESRPQAVAGTDSAHASIALFPRISPQPTRAVASVSIHSGCKRSRDDVCLLPSKRICSHGEIFQTHLEIPLVSDSVVPPVDGGACNERETTVVVALPSASSVGSAPSMVTSTYMPRIRYCLDNYRFLNRTLNSLRHHVVIPKLLATIRSLELGATVPLCEAGVAGRGFLLFSLLPSQTGRSCDLTRIRHTCAVLSMPCGLSRRYDCSMKVFGD